MEGPVTGVARVLSRGWGIQSEERVPKHCKQESGTGAGRGGVWRRGRDHGGQGRRLTVEALNCQHVVPAEQRVAAQPLVVGRHERARRGRVRQAERVADFVRQHHEQVAPTAAAQGPVLVLVEVSFAPARQKGVR